jgi:ferrochelatase
MEKETNLLSWTWGFTSSAENWNGRLAMLGFLFTLLIEVITGKGVLHSVGLI